MRVRGVRLHGAHDARYEEFEIPEIKDGEILLKVMTDSVCMSTWKAINQGEKHIRVPEDISEKPIITGHEFSGIIAKVGKRWENEYRVGEQFVIMPAVPGQMESPGYSYEFFGGDVSYCIVPEDVIEKGCLMHYSGNSFYEASTSEPLFCIICGFKTNYHTEEQSHEHNIGTREGGNIIILGGAGPMGLGAVAYAIAQDRKPARVVVTDLNQDRIARARVVIPEEYARENGVELHYINVAEYDDPEKVLMEISEGKGYDDVFVFAPVRSLAEQGDRLLAVDGCLSIFAGASDRAFSGSINLYNAHYRRTKVVGSSGGYMCDMLESLKMISENRINPAVMITHIGGIDSAAETSINLPAIPGGKKLVYTQIEMPMTAIADFEKLGADDELFRKLAASCRKNKGLWNKEAENILLDHFHVER